MTLTTEELKTLKTLRVEVELKLKDSLEGKSEDYKTGFEEAFILVADYAIELLKSIKEGQTGKLVLFPTIKSEKATELLPGDQGFLSPKSVY